MSVISVLVLGLAVAAQDVPQSKEALRLDALIQSMGDPIAEAREKAMIELRAAAAEHGTLVRERLKEHLGHTDLEVAARCRALLAEFKRADELAAIKGKVIYVDAKNNFVVLDIGRRQGLVPGTPFKIYRGTANGDTLVATGEVEKFLGQDSLSKIVVAKGAAAEVAVDDFARVAAAPPAGAGRARPREAAPLAGKISLVDEARGKVVIDLRAGDSVQVGDPFRVTRDGKPVGSIVIIQVEAWGSWVKLSGETRYGDLQKGDRVELQGKK